MLRKPAAKSGQISPRNHRLCQPATMPVNITALAARLENEAICGRPRRRWPSCTALAKLSAAAQAVRRRPRPLPSVHGAHAKRAQFAPHCAAARVLHGRLELRDAAISLAQLPAGSGRPTGSNPTHQSCCKNPNNRAATEATPTGVEDREARGHRVAGPPEESEKAEASPQTSSSGRHRLCKGSPGRVVPRGRCP